MITAELRARAEELMSIECIHREAWIELVRDLLREGSQPAEDAESDLHD